MPSTSRPLADLRSDTVTRPTPAMRAAMADAEVGDDQYGEDPTVAELEAEAARVLGKEAALFVTSGVMGNQLALRTQTRPGDEVVAAERSHLVAYEDDAGPLLAGIRWRRLPDGDGLLSLDDVEAAFDGSGPRPGLLALEDTHMASGGVVWPPDRLAAAAEVAHRAGVSVHLDGARLWNAAAALGATPAVLAAPADTVMCCLSKGLAAPVGSVLAGPADLIAAARTERHRLGGAWRQAGILAAAGLVALTTMRSRLVDDHVAARSLALAVEARWPGSTARPPDTNIVVFAHPEPDRVVAHLGARGVLASRFGPAAVRLVTHADVTAAGLEAAIAALADA